MVAVSDRGELAPGESPGGAVYHEWLCELQPGGWGEPPSLSSASPPAVHVLDDASAADPPHRQWLQPSPRGPVGFWNHQWAGESPLALGAAHVDSLLRTQTRGP